MSDIDAEAAKLDKALDDALFEVLEDFDAPQATRDAADRLLKQRLNDKLKAAIGDFQASALKLVDIVAQLQTAVDALAKSPLVGAKAALTSVISQAGELLRRVHDQQGMRTTHTTIQEAEAPHPDEKMLPPLLPPAGEKPPPVTPLNETGQVLDAPAPTDSTRYEALSDEYMRFFAGAAVKDANAQSVARNAEMCLRFRPRYEKVGGPLGIPWWFIACVHMLESSFNFTTHLHNGDPLSSRTFRVPAGRPGGIRPTTGNRVPRMPCAARAWRTRRTGRCRARSTAGKPITASATARAASPRPTCGACRPSTAPGNMSATACSAPQRCRSSAARPAC